MNFLHHKIQESVVNIFFSELNNQHAMQQNNIQKKSVFARFPDYQTVIVGNVS